MRPRSPLLALLGPGLLWSACQKPPAAPEPSAAPTTSAAPSASASPPRFSPGGLAAGEIPPLSLPQGLPSNPPVVQPGGELSLTGVRGEIGAWRTLPSPRPPFDIHLLSTGPLGYLHAGEPPRNFTVRKPVKLTCGNYDPWSLRHQTLRPGEGEVAVLTWADYWLDFRDCRVSFLERGELSLSVLLRWGKLPIALALRGPSSVTLLFPPGARLSLPQIRNGMELESDSLVRLRVPTRPGMALNLVAEIDPARLVSWSEELGIASEKDRAPGRATVMIDLSQTVSDRDVVLAASFVQAP